MIKKGLSKDMHASYTLKLADPDHIAFNEISDGKETFDRSCEGILL